MDLLLILRDALASSFVGNLLTSIRARQAGSDAGVVLYACPHWASLLNLEGGLPEGLSSLETPALIELLRNARQVVGTL